MRSEHESERCTFAVESTVEAHNVSRAKATSLREDNFLEVCTDIAQLPEHSLIHATARARATLYQPSAHTVIAPSTGPLGSCQRRVDDHRLPQFSEISAHVSFQFQIGEPPKKCHQQQVGHRQPTSQSGASCPPPGHWSVCCWWCTHAELNLRKSVWHGGVAGTCKHARTHAPARSNQVRNN